MTGGSQERVAVALFGGSFNPPHVVHEEAARLVLDDGRWSALWVVPTHLHPFGKSLAPFDDRLAMCRLTFEAFGEAVEVLDIEREIDGVSYTVNTVEALQQAHPRETFSLVVGSDVLSESPQWKDLDRLQRLVGFVILPRQDYPTRDERVLRVPPLRNISSSEIRHRLAEGLSIDGLVNPAVQAYIRERGLYKGRDSLPGPVHGARREAPGR